MAGHAWADQVIAVLIVLIGAPMGSFAALLAERLPCGRPVVRARSICAGCNAALRWWELIPIFSFIFLRGLCARCGAAIPARLLEAELAGLALGGLAVWAGLGLAGALVLWCLLALILCDLWRFRLPDVLTAALLVLALTVAALSPGTNGSLAARTGLALAGAGIGFGAFLAISLAYRMLRGRAGMGAGDIRLMAGIGALIVPSAGWVGLAMVTLIAGLAGIGLGLVQSLRRQRSLRGAMRLPFGACLGMATIAVWVWVQAGATWPPGLLAP